MNMFTISKIYANNFKGIPYRPVNSVSDLMIFELNKEGLIILSGPNGYGKTTMFDIIEIILSKKITRFNSTRSGNASIKDNGLLNNKDINGLIGIEFSNNVKQFSILAELPKGGGRAEIDSDISAIKLYKFEGNLIETQIETSEFAKMNELELSSLEMFESISDINSIPEFQNFNSNAYNLFYYISQEESTHFLKEKENNKLTKLDSLVDIEKHLKKSQILNTLVNNRSGKIKNEIDKINGLLDDKYKVLNMEVHKIEDVAFMKIFDNIDVPWDKETFNQGTEEDLSEYLSEVYATKSLFTYSDAFNDYLFNKRIDNINVSKETFLDYVLLKNNQMLIFDNQKIDEERMTDIIKKYEQNINLQKLKDIFNKPNLESEFSHEDITKWSENLQMECVPVERYNEIIKEIGDLKERLSSGNKIFDEVLNDRTQFINSYKKAVDENIRIECLNDKKCPLCGTDYESNILNKKIEDMKIYISSTMNQDQDNLKSAREKLKDYINDYYEKVKEIEFTQIINADSYKKLKKLSMKSAAKKNVEKLLDVINELHLKIDDNVSTIELLLELIKSNKKILSDEFSFENKKMGLYEIYNKYFKEIYKDLIEDSTFITKLENKSKYIQNKINLLKNTKYHSLYNEIFDLEKKLILLEDTKSDFEKYKEEIDKSIDDFREKLIKDIEIPLYLYTGKILQNYQRGLGVVIKKTNTSVKFVPNKKTDHEIINSFSSGQLSGFIIAFMLVMNKVYTGRESAINTILIDDPVQTMDDINIASFVDVLRHEFDDKQIIISSHEINKALYMMYKFSKYNINYELKNVSKMFKQLE